MDSIPWWERCLRLAALVVILGGGILVMGAILRGCERTLIGAPAPFPRPPRPLPAKPIPRVCPGAYDLVEGAVSYRVILGPNGDWDVNEGGRVGRWRYLPDGSIEILEWPSSDPDGGPHGNHVRYHVRPTAPGGPDDYPGTATRTYHYLGEPATAVPSPIPYRLTRRPGL